jgi:solute carrier family 5 (sodium-coupled monocarboxylate transporter), member 8/12
MNQNTVQRYLSLKSTKSARKSLTIFTISTIFMISLCTYNGLLLYATYYDCDPLTLGVVKAKDQMMPLLVVRVLSNYPGLSGLFVAGVFSASLSSASTALNSLSAIVLKDFCPAREMSGMVAGMVMRGTVVILGIFSVLLVYVVQNLGIVLQLALSIIGTFGGPLVGIFIVGMVLPWIGSRATFYSAIISLTTVSIIIFKAQMEVLSGDFRVISKEMRIDGCGLDVPDSANNDTTSYGSHFNQISYLYYTPIGVLIVVVFSVLLSFIFGFEDLENANGKLFAPFVRKFLKNNFEIAA